MYLPMSSHNKKQNPYHEINTHQEDNFQSNTNANNRKIQSRNNNELSDQLYFNSLQHYKPIFYKGQGTPVFFWNEHWFKSFSCILFFDFIFAGCVIYFIVNAIQQSNQGQSNSINSKGLFYGDNLTTFIASISCLTLVNVTYFLCQFLNPGLSNPTSLTQEQLNAEDTVYCQHCQRYKTKNMSHCRDCKVCVWGLDHHCGFFNKCIAGWQKWAFYAFLISIFCGFLIIIVCLCFALNFQ